VTAHNPDDPIVPSTLAGTAPHWTSRVPDRRFWRGEDGRLHAPLVVVNGGYGKKRGPGRPPRAREGRTALHLEPEAAR
jgi:hypothetical protein